MTVEPGQEPATPRRKFDDVASLFGTIVPAPGALPRPIAAYAPPTVPEPKAPPLPSRPPPALARMPEPDPEPPPPPPPPPRPVSRPHPKELPWPDAFEPRPNYRRREPRNWSWLLLIPVGFVAAVGITMLDPRSIRMWLDDNVLHRTPEPGTMEPPPLLAMPGVPSPSAAPVATAPVAPPVIAPPPSTTPTPAPAPPAEAPILYPAIPTSPVPAAPGVDVSPPPVDPAPAPARPPPVRITIQYRRNIPGSEGEARRVAALLQSYGGSIELHPNPTTVRVPTINYYNPADKAAATTLATVLANEATNWAIRAGTGKYPPGSLEIWLP